MWGSVGEGGCVQSRDNDQQGHSMSYNLKYSTARLSLGGSEVLASVLGQLSGEKQRGQSQAITSKTFVSLLGT